MAKNHSYLYFAEGLGACIRKSLAKVHKDLRVAGVLPAPRKSLRKQRVNRSARRRFSAREQSPQQNILKSDYIR